MLLVILKLQQSVCLYFQRFGLLSKMQMWSHRGFGDVLIICDCPYNCRGVCLCVCECAVHQASANLILIVNRNELFGKDARRQIIKVNQTTNHTKTQRNVQSLVHQMHITWSYLTISCMVCIHCKSPLVTEAERPWTSVNKNRECTIQKRRL